MGGWVLEAGHHRAIGAKLHLLHSIVETDEVLDVDIGLEIKFLGGRVEVDVEA